VAGRHALHRLARTEETADDVGGQHAGEPAGIHLLDAHVPLEDAGVVYQCRHAPQLRIDLLEKTHDVVLDAHVRRHGHRLSASINNVLHDGIRGLAVAQIGDAHCVAACRSQARRRCTNAAAAAGDDGDLVQERPP
jgi:hypothetical protein